MVSGTIRKETIVANSMHNPGIYMRITRKTLKILRIAIKPVEIQIRYLSNKSPERCRYINMLNIVTCYLGSQPIQRFVARQQLRKYATVMETLLGTRPRVTMEV
jgi:hypothetical protein